jgi:hypothetical protein
MLDIQVGIAALAGIEIEAKNKNILKNRSKTYTYELLNFYLTHCVALQQGFVDEPLP